jgi:hypothetical protein
MRHFTFLHAIKVWPLEGDLAYLQGPEFPGIGECKRLPSRDPKSPEDFSGMGTAKKATARTSCCNIHNATTPGQRANNLRNTSKYMGASKSMSKDKSMEASNSRADNRRKLSIAWMPATSWTRAGEHGRH